MAQDKFAVSFVGLTWGQLGVCILSAVNPNPNLERNSPFLFAPMVGVDIAIITLACVCVVYHTIHGGCVEKLAHQRVGG